MSIPSHAISSHHHARASSPPHLNRVITGLILVALLGSGCSVDWSGFLTPPAPLTNTTAPTPTLISPTPAFAGEVTFQVETPANTPPDQPVYLNVLEEVNGLAINAHPYEMQAVDANHYVLSLPFAIGSVIKYRYSRQAPAAQVVEHTSDGRQVRYRLYHVTAPGSVADVVSRWTDTEVIVGAGRISGLVRDASTGLPVSGLLAAAGGAQALTAADGTFLLEGLPPGVHNLALYALDGAYRTFQQGARVEAQANTPAEIQMSAAPLVNIVFVATLPEDTIPAIPVRIAGNLLQFGNTYANLAGGVSTIAARMPTLLVLPDGRYAVSLALPAGADLHYLYTLGDGFWNTEKASGEAYPIRQLIIPDNGAQVDDRVESWTTGDAAPITFDVTVPANTPASDTVSLQLNPLFGWTEPIPMWPLGANRWAYVLNSPPGLTGELRYRFCRNDQCGSADDSQTMGNENPGYPITPGIVAQTVVETIDSWAWLGTQSTGEPITAPPVAVRGAGFLAGVELQPSFHPSWVPLVPRMLDEVQHMSANWVILTPTWSFTRQAPPVLEQVTGQDALLQDLAAQIDAVHGRSLNAALFPSPHFPGDPAAWWQTAPRDFAWWQAWFASYRSFLLHHAGLAAQRSAQALILGGDWLEPALPGGTLADGTTSGAPEDTEARWRTLIQEVRAIYPGPILWALSYDQAFTNPPPFLDAVDQVYVLFSSRLADRPDPLPEELQAEAERLLDTGLLPLQASTGKPIILAAAYPSANGAGQACFPDDTGSCLPLDALARPNPPVETIGIDLQEQADIYSALLNAVNQRTWISGFVTRGFYPPASLQDPSASVRGKPAQDVTGYWFAQLLGATTP